MKIIIKEMIDSETTWYRVVDYAARVIREFRPAVCDFFNETQNFGQNNVLFFNILSFEFHILHEFGITRSLEVFQTGVYSCNDFIVETKYLIDLPFLDSKKKKCKCVQQMAIMETYL